MAVELATAYISLVPSTRGFAAETNKQITPEMSKQGGQIGDGMLAGIGKSLKVGAVAVGALAVGGIGTALVKGFSRLDGLDQATAKLSGLGHSAETVESIMQNALASVSGTAFGMDAAAGTAAQLVAAGIAPGQELERTLKAVADSATIAGVDMDSMGSIFGKVASSGKVQGDVIAQLSDAGVPALALLAKELGVTSEEASKMASRGEIDFATFQSAMEGGMGGAALASGATFSGAMDNMGAALGRVGANLLSGVFPQMKDGLGGITEFLGPLEEKAAAAGEAFGVWAAEVGPKVVDVLKNVGDFGATAFAWVGDNIGLLKTIGGVVLGLAAGLLVYRGVMVALAVPTMIQTAAITAQNIALRLNPIGLVVTAIIALIAAIVWIATQTTFFQDVWAGMVEIFHSSVGMFADFFSNTGGMFADFFSNTVGMFSDFVSNTVGMFADFFSNTMGMFSDFAGHVSAFMAPILEGIGAVFSWLYDTIITPIIFGVMLYVGLWAALFTWLWTGVVSPALAAIGAVFVWLYETVIKPVFDGIAAVFGFVGGVIDAALAAIQAVWLTVWGAIVAFFTAIWTTIVSVVTGYINTMMSIITTIIGVISSIWATVWGVISAVFGTIWAGIVASVTFYINLVRTIISTVVGAVSGIWSSVWGGISSFFTGIWNGIVSAVQSFGGFFRSAFSGIAGFVTNAFAGVLQAVKGPINGIIGIVNGAIGALNRLSVTIPDWVPVVGGQSFSLGLPTIPRLAAGGIVSRRPGGIIANIGEGRYDEAVVPLSPAFLRSLSGSSRGDSAGGDTITFTGPMGLSPDDVADSFTKKKRRANARSGVGRVGVA